MYKGSNFSTFSMGQILIQTWQVQNNNNNDSNLLSV